MLMARQQRLDRELINSLIYIRSGRVLSPAAAAVERTERPSSQARN